MQRKLLVGVSALLLVTVLTYVVASWISSRHWSDCREALRQGNYALAVTLAEERLKQRPNDPRGMLYAARGYARLGRWAKAEGYFAQVPLRELEDFHWRGRGLEARLLYAEAARVYEECLQRWPKDGEALQHLAAIRSQQERDDEALVLARRLTKIDSHQVAGYVMCGILEHHRRNHAQAAEDLQAALRIAPNLEGIPNQTWMVLTFLAEDLVWLGKGREAEQYAAKAREMSTAPEPSWALGRARQLLGDEEGARSAWEEALARDPNFVSALQDLGHLYLKRRELARAMRCFTRANELQPDDDTIKYALETTRRHMEFEKDGGSHDESGQPVSASPNHHDDANVRDP